MPLVKTNLTAAIKASDLVWTVASTATGFPVVGTVGANQPVMVDDEVAFITGVPNTTQIVVRGRGSDGTLATVHDVNAPVVTSPVVSDFQALASGALTLRPLTARGLDTYGQDGAIIVPIQDTNAFIDKAAAAALTLAAPSLGSNGLILLITSTTAAAHAITTPALLNNAAAGSPFNTVTFPAQIGASISLIAQNGFWNVANTQGTMVFT